MKNLLLLFTKTRQHKDLNLDLKTVLVPKYLMICKYIYFLIMFNLIKK